MIGVDGANSAIRPLVTLSDRSTPASARAARHAPRLHALTQGGKVFGLGNSQTRISSVKGDGGLSFYTGCRTVEYWVRDSGINFTNAAQVLAWFRQEYTEWNEV